MMSQAQWQTVYTLTALLDEEEVDYSLIEEAALLAQGVEIAEEAEVDVLIQWDLFQEMHERLRAYGAGEIVRGKSWDRFACTIDGVAVNVHCNYNTVVAADPYRVAIEVDDKTLWAKSLHYYLRHLAHEDPRWHAVKSYLRTLQEQNAKLNEVAWNQEAYEAWLHRFGTPIEQAARISKNPEGRLVPFGSYLGDLDGKKAINLLGSHGGKGVAMSLLGATVTVVDISHENARYAMEVAEAAAVSMRYVVSDVLHLPDEELTGDYDLVLMELGILHYFVDLEPLMTVVTQLLRTGGRFVLHDFHPISTKLITSKGKKHKVVGNYFNQKIEETTVAFSKHLAAKKQETLKKTYQRKWTLAEVVTACAEAGLFLRVLSEEPNTKADDRGLPKTFTLVAEKV
ncbi:MAG TPA: methyltransferase domain-containing protein [Bacilli bacterium]|nr:methyltransferase domain-containing protein [Bacilli bacterium]